MFRPVVHVLIKRFPLNLFTGEMNCIKVTLHKNFEREIFMLLKGEDLLR